MQREKRNRLLGKLAIIFAVCLLLLFVLLGVFSERALDEIKHALSLWTLVSLVIFINLISFLCFIVMFSAWRWIQRDIKPPKDKDLDI